MKVGIGNAAVLLIWLMHGEVHYHAPAHKVLQQKLPCQSNVLLHGKLVLQGNVKTVCKLRFLAALGIFYGVPERFTVCVLWRRVGWQQGFRADHAALAGVVAVLTVILAVQLFPGTVGSRRHGGLPRAALDLRHMEMK